MTIRTPRIKDPATLLRIGYAALALASLSHWLLPRSGLLPPDAIDGSFGLLTGIAIGTLLLGIRARARRSDGHEGGPDASA
jgi:hypothetical protein